MWPDLDSTCTEDCTDAVELMKRFRLKAMNKRKQSSSGSNSNS